MNKTINFTDVNPFNNKIQKAINKSILNTIIKKDFILGSNVKKFEDKFSKLSNSKYAIGCATGTDALILSLKSLNLKKDEEVIIPGMSYISTGLCVSLNNNKIVFADIDEKTGLISFESIEKKLSKKTKVIIPVNLYGQKVNIKLLRKIVGRKVFIIEDSAQSHFSSICHDCKNSDHISCFKKEKSHKYADLSCYSFYPSKNLGAYGDGGMITTENLKFYKKLLTLRNLGTIKKNCHQHEGINSRLDTLQASILLQKLKYTPINNNYRRKISAYYDKRLSDINKIRLTITDPGSSRHLYVIRVKNRNRLAKYLKKKNIATQFHYPYSLNRVGALKKKIKNVRLPISENWANECISLPLYPGLGISRAKYIIKQIKNFFRYK